MKKVLSILLCIALLAAICAVPAAALTEEEANAGYYLVGSMTGWGVNSAYRLDLNPADSSEYRYSGLPLTMADDFKVVYSHNGSSIDEWYPAGLDNNCSLATLDIHTDGTVDLYFRPNMDGDDSWYFGCIYAELKSVKPTENIMPTLPEPMPDVACYVVFKGDQNRIRERNRMYRMWENAFEIHNLTLSTATPFKIALTQEIGTEPTLFPAGEDDYYVPRYNSAYYTVVFTPDGNNGGDSSDMGWYDGYVRAYPCEPPQENPTDYVPVTVKEMKTNRYEAAFDAAYPTAEYLCDYEELYYHRDRYDNDDWTLVKTTSYGPIDGGGYGVFDDLAVFSAEDYPFTLGFGIFDHSNHTFYSITQAWNGNYDGLHDVFAHIAPQYAAAALLGDADGDNELTILDVTHIQRRLANMEELDDEWMFEHSSNVFGSQMTYLSDYDRDGQRTVLDATLLQRALVGTSRYPHDFTASVRLEKSGDTVSAVASTSFGGDAVQYFFTIEGGVHAGTVYGGDWGKFTYFDPEYEYVPGNEHLATGWIADSSVELPLRALTYNDDYVLTVIAKTPSGRVTKQARLYFKNVY
ncbi:MAG: hypothetical protein IJH07_08560 [Ruminococcus sp.]|nr:hypothetical protein [Ruminococcus sp.]